MGTPTTKTEMLKITREELVKQYVEFDVQTRPYKIHTAPVWAKNGDPCIVTEILYVDNTSTTVLGQKEGYTTWDTGWVPDASFTVSDTVAKSKTDLIVTAENEIVKQYQERDGQSRVVRLYEASVYAKTGSPCKVTEYIYLNGTSTQIKGKKEGYSTWDETWVPDSAFTVGY